VHTTLRGSMMPALTMSVGEVCGRGGGGVTLRVIMCVLRGGGACLLHVRLMCCCARQGGGQCTDHNGLVNIKKHDFTYL
jgi:hypothetical protein